MCIRDRGLERTAYLLQGVANMYEIDEIFPVITRAADLAGTRYGADAQADVRLRVVGDHIRSALMLMTDGVTPGNEARGYVLRRLLRRTIRSMRLLGVHDTVPVSYTHLDVYKRQDLRRPAPAAAIRLRSQVSRAAREVLAARDFVEIETPTLTLSLIHI